MSAIRETLDGITFAVDRVDPAAAALPGCQARATAEVRFGRTPEICAEPDRTLVAGPPGALEDEHGLLHPLVGAVHLAFSQHRPLVLTPDAVWLTIAQGVAQHVNRHSQALRRDLVGHDGTRVLRVSTDRYPTTEREWAGVIDGFATGLTERHGDLARVVVCDFTTTTPVDRLASQVILMDTFRRYYDYVLACICGIPEVTLTGTVSDWQEIANRVDTLGRWGLGFWARHLAPLCRQFVRARRGDVDLGHWQAIYKIRTAYGSQLVNGWLGLLFPYVGEGEKVRRNPALAVPPGSYLAAVAVPDPGHGGLGMAVPSPFGATWLSTGDFPTGLSSVPVHVVDPVTGGSELRDLVAGLVGIEQRGLALCPISGWAVMPGVGVAAAMTRLAPMIRSARRSPEARRQRARVDGVPADLVQFCATHDGAVIGDPHGPAGALSILPLNEMRSLRIESANRGGRRPEPGGPPGRMAIFADLPDGALAVAGTRDGWPVLRWRRDPGRAEPHPAAPGQVTVAARRSRGTLEVIARSFSHFLTLIHDRGDPLFAVRPDFEPRESWPGLVASEGSHGPWMSGPDGDDGGDRAPYWDEQPAAWRIVRRVEYATWLAVHTPGLRRRQIEAVRRIDPGAERIDARQFGDRLRATETYLLGPLAPDDVAGRRAALHAAGVPYRAHVEPVTHHDIVHRPSGHHLAIQVPAERDHVLTEMIAAGVEVVGVTEGDEGGGGGGGSGDGGGGSSGGGGGDEGGGTGTLRGW